MKALTHFKLKGCVKVTVRDAKSGRVLQQMKVTNIVVTVGKQQICDLLIGASTASFTHCGVGSGTTTPTVGDTALEAEITHRKAVTDRFRTATTAVFSTFFGTADNNGNWNESGLFTAATGGIMLCRALFDATVVKDETKTLTLDWDIEVT